MPSRPSRDWFRVLLDSSPDVYFRYARRPHRGFVYVSPAVHTLTGRTPEEFYKDAAACVGLIAPDDRRILRQILRSRRTRVVRLAIVRDDVAVPIEVRSVALVRDRRVVAIEGVARLVAGSAPNSAVPGPRSQAASPSEPIQARLAALMYQVHDLLHQVLPPNGEERKANAVLRLGALALDVERLTVSEAGEAVSLTPREVQVLKYLLQRPERVTTRRQLLEEVWGYRYTGDDRTVDVHMSRLRRKLPSLRARLVAIRNVGYRLEDGQEHRGAVNG